MDKIPKPGEFYRDTENKLYQVVTAASLCGTGEKLAVYQALYGDFQTYAQPLPAFLRQYTPMERPADTAENPSAAPERTADTAENLAAAPERPADTAENPAAAPERTADATESPADISEGAKEAGDRIAPNPCLVEFLEAETYREKLKILEELKKNAGREEVDGIFEALDLKETEGSVEQKLALIEKHLKMLEKYDGKRLR